MIGRKSRRDLMCVGRYAAKVMRNERSEMEHNRSEMPANVAEQICIPAGCDFAINDNLVLSHSAGMHDTGTSIAGISKRFHFASLHYIFSAYLPTYIKFLTEFHRSSFLGTTCLSIQIIKPYKVGKYLIGFHLQLLYIRHLMTT